MENIWWHFISSLFWASLAALHAKSWKQRLYQRKVVIILPFACCVDVSEVIYRDSISLYVVHSLFKRKPLQEGFHDQSHPQELQCPKRNACSQSRYIYKPAREDDCLAEEKLMEWGVKWNPFVLLTSQHFNCILKCFTYFSLGRENEHVGRVLVSDI